VSAGASASGAVRLELSSKDEHWHRIIKRTFFSSNNANPNRNQFRYYRLGSLEASDASPDESNDRLADKREDAGCSDDVWSEAEGDDKERDEGT
jgi:hypothetical protein